jgi:ferrous iron transport protein A
MSAHSTRLSQLHKGERAIIISFDDEVMKQKFLEMGCLPGEEIIIDRFAPLGCPVAIRLNGSTLGIRLEEAESIIVKPVH